MLFWELCTVTVLISGNIFRRPIVNMTFAQINCLEIYSRLLIKKEKKKKFTQGQLTKGVQLI